MKSNKKVKSIVNKEEIKNMSEESIANSISDLKNKIFFKEQRCFGIVLLGSMCFMAVPVLAFLSLSFVAIPTALTLAFFGGSFKISKDIKNLNEQLKALLKEHKTRCENKNAEKNHQVSIDEYCKEKNIQVKVQTGVEKESDLNITL